MYESNAQNAPISIENEPQLNPELGINTTDDQSPLVHQDDGIFMKRIQRISSATAHPFPVIYEVASDAQNPSNPEISFAPSASSASYNLQKQRRSTGVGPYERQLSILDPMSDRVSTILVWRNLTVYAAMPAKWWPPKILSRSENREPQRKTLLHNVSGAITGGLWAVMGKSTCLFTFVINQ